jgi:hypothetical protein
VPVTVAACFISLIVPARSNMGIIGSNLNQGIEQAKGSNPYKLKKKKVLYWPDFL